MTQNTNSYISSYIATYVSNILNKTMVIYTYKLLIARNCTQNAYTHTHAHTNILHTHIIDMHMYVTFTVY